MDTRKITLIATIAVIALIAVGVGYAYTATTVNDNNTTQSEYVVLSQGVAENFTFVKDETGYDTNSTIYFDSVNSSTGTRYTLKAGNNVSANAGVVAGITGANSVAFYGLQLGKASEITATYTGPEDQNRFPIGVKINNGPGTISADNDWVAIIVFEYNSTKQYAMYNGSWSYHAADGAAQDAINLIEHSNDDYSETYTMTLYYGAFNSVKTGQTYWDCATSTTAPSANPLNDFSFEFYWTNNPTHTVTYNAGDGTGNVPTQGAVIAGFQFVLANGNTLTPPQGKVFAGWSDGTATYQAGATYTMGDSNVTLTAQYETA